jgi:FMN phosphatase YigB (HAD superfamily)
MPLAALQALDPKTFDAISVDVFDTILQRDHKGQRRRFAEIAAELSRRLKQDAYSIDIALLYQLRLAVHELAYRAVGIERPEGDVKFECIERIQTTLLGIGPASIGHLRDAELIVERRSLRANHALINWLVAMSREGKPVIAISDMYLPTTAVTRLINECARTAPIGRIYVSSDIGLTKRSGRLFESVAAAEGVAPGRMLHCGDDPDSDLAMARAAGMQTVLLAMPPQRRIVRGFSSLLGAFAEPRLPRSWAKPHRVSDQREFGHHVMGPIFAEFALKTWIFLSTLEFQDDTVLLFCARGGLRLQVIYEAFLAASGLDNPVASRALMVSRIVAARSALLKRSAIALEQLNFEFNGHTLRDAARAISGMDADCGALVADPLWDMPYSKAGLEALLASPESTLLVSAASQQDALFREHLESCAGGRSRIILCDSGLFGSTLNFLQEAIPEKRWSSLLFARANYKRARSPHFRDVLGIATEDDHYSPFRARTSVLRYWHLIEAILEPPLPSASSFTRIAGVVRSNLEIDGWSEMIVRDQDEIFAGTLDYVRALRPANATVRIMTEAETAFRRLRRRVLWPSRDDARLLQFPDRPVDFGKDSRVPIVARGRGLLHALKASEWREGAIAELAPPPLRLALLALVEAAYAARWLTNRCLRRSH